MFRALRFRDFRLLWLSQSVSVIGDALVVVAIGLYVTGLTHHPSDVALVLAAYALPMVVFLLLGGVVADRLPRQLVMLTSDLVRALLHGTLAVLIATGTVRIWHMVVIGLFYGAAEAFFRPAYTGLVPQTVPERDIQRAQALGGLSSEIAEMASPALATLLVLGVGGSVAFAIDAVTFLISAALLFRVRPRPRGTEVQSGTVLQDLAQGWQAVRQRPWVMWTIVGISISLFTALAPFYVVGATVAREQYGSAAVFGWTNAAFGVGTVSGAVVAARWRPRHPIRVGLFGAVPWSLAIAVYGTGFSVIAAYVSMAVGGLGFGCYLVWWETALATRVPGHLLSRVSAWDWMGSLALLPLGYIVSGTIADKVGAGRLLVGGGLLAAVATASVLGSRSAWTLTRLEQDGEPDNGAVGGPDASRLAVTGH